MGEGGTPWGWRQKWQKVVVGPRDGAGVSPKVLKLFECPDFSLCPPSPLFLPAASDAELPEHEKAFIQFHITMPEGPSLRVLLQDPEERRKLGKCIHPWGKTHFWVMKP